MLIDEPVQKSGAIHRISYAQNMEDILLDRLFGGQVGTFMDIGANHPFLDSNTYYFYVRGWRGVNLEPSPEACKLFAKHRPDDLTLAVAASDEEAELPFYEIVGQDGATGLSTLSAEVADHHRAEGFRLVEHRVPVRTVATLIDEHGIEPPDFVSIDVESHEGHVLRGIPLDRWRPKVLVVESTLPLSHAASHQSWEPILLENGYLFAAFNGVNRFYLRDDLRDKLDCFATPVNVLDEYQRHETIVYLHGLEKLKSDLESERFHFEQERGGWAWAQTQARHAQAMWEQERAAIEAQRTSWKDALEFFERSQVDWDRERQHFATDRAAWDQARALYERDRAEWDRLRADWQQQHLEFALARTDWERERVYYLEQLSATQGELRPYRLIDRLGVVRAGYGFARKIKRKLGA